MSAPQRLTDERKTALAMMQYAWTHGVPGNDGYAIANSAYRKIGGHWPEPTFGEPVGAGPFVLVGAGPFVLDTALPAFVHREEGEQP